MDDAHADAWLSQVNQLDKDGLIQLVGHYSDRYRTAYSEVERLNRVVSCLGVSQTPEGTQEIINLLRNSDRPQSHAKLMEDAAALLGKLSKQFWHPFSEKPPERGCYICRMNDGDSIAYADLKFDDGWYGQGYRTITHWAQIPMILWKE